MAMTPERATEFKDDVSNKIETLLDEFAGGSISRAHFDVVYQRYSRQLTIADQALESGELEEIDKLINDIPTMMLHQAARGIAIGMSIIHRLDMHIIRQFGTLDLDDSQQNSLMTQIETRQDNDITDFSHIEHLGDHHWIVICTLEHTSLLTLFRNEPAAKQVQELERRHRDFESANRNILNQLEPDPDTLVYPLELFVNRPT